MYTIIETNDHDLLHLSMDKMVYN